MQTLLFDLDGTISDPKEGITKALAFALQKFGIAVPDLDALEVFIGPPLHESFMQFYAMDATNAMQCVQYYRAYFATKGLYENVVYDQIEECLRWLKKQGVPCIIATSKPERFAKKIITYFHLDAYFKDVCGADMEGLRCKKGDVIAYAMQKHHLKKDTLMIGDRKHDIIGAKENGIKSIGVLYGYGSLQELQAAQADYIVEDIAELMHCIAQFI